MALHHFILASVLALLPLLSHAEFRACNLQVKQVEPHPNLSLLKRREAHILIHQCYKFLITNTLIMFMGFCIFTQESTPKTSATAE